MTPEQIAAYARGQFEAFDTLPPDMREFLRNVDIPIDAAKVPAFLAQYGERLTKRAIQQTVDDFKAKNPMVVGPQPKK